MTTTVRQATALDFRWIVDLIDRHRGTDLSDAERAKRGFVQGDWSVSRLFAFAAGTGIFLAEVDGVRAGVAITSPSGLLPIGPAGRVNDLAAAAFGEDARFLYGPVVVDDEFRGRGVLRALFECLVGALRDRYALGVAFIEATNSASLAVHARLGLQRFADFEHDGRVYHALAFRT